MQTREEKKKHFTSINVAWGTCVVVAMVAGLVATAICTLLIANYFQVRGTAPLDNPQLLALRQQLAAAPEADPKLIQQIETLDLLARRAYFSSQAQIKSGAYLLLGSVTVLLVALRLAATFRPRVPQPQAEPSASEYWTARARARVAIAIVGGVFVVAALAAALLTRVDIPTPAGETTAVQQEAAVTVPDWETMKKNWPSFRGPGAYGVAVYTTAPTEWDVQSGKNVKWKVEVPLPGRNSPVVWGNRIFLSSATDAVREVYCFDTESGQMLWKRALEKFQGTPDTLPEVGEDTGYAAPTMVAHGDRVFAIFGNGDLACYDFEGNMKWGKNLGVPQNHYGHASSLLAYGSLLFVQYDQAEKAKLFAFDTNDGHEAWTVDRPYISWASPVCVQTSFGPQLVLNDEKNVDAYDPVTGKQIWQLECLDGEVAPSPAYGGGMFFVANDYATATAIRFSKDSTTPKPEIAWQWDEALPDVSSPVGTDTHFYIATSRGYIMCLDIATGQVAYGQEFDEGFYSSPIVVGDRIYAVDQMGATHIFKTGPTYEAIGSPKLGEETGATPAFMDGRIYFRTEKSLICVARQDEPGN